MSTHHAASGEIVDLATWADDLPFEKSKVIFKTEGLELARLVIKSGVTMQSGGYCSVDGPIVVHCIEGEVKVKVKTPEREISLKPGQLGDLEGGTEHALTGELDSLVLLTITLV